MQAAGLPIRPLIFNEDDEVFWGIPDSKILEPYQLEINEIRTQRMRHRRMALIKIITKVNAFSPEEASKLVDEDVGPVIQTNIQGDIRGSVM